MGNLARAFCLALLGALSCVSMSMADTAEVNPRLWVQRFAPPLTSDYVGPVVEARDGFSSAVASWNVQASPPAWLDIQMRVRIGERWSAWYDMGHWSADLASGNRRSIAKQADGDGHVDTDTLFLTKPASALQLQAFLHAGPQNTPLPALSLLAVTTDAPANEDTAPQAWGEDIDVPQRTQHVMESPAYLGGGGEAWCSPTSISMVAAFWAQQLHHPEWNFDVPTAAQGTYDPVYDGCGNWPFNIAYASEHGLAGWVERLRGLHDVERYIAHGVPVVASIKVAKGEMEGTPYVKTDGHLLVVRGFTAQGDVIVNDPAGRTGAIRRVYQREQFAHAWLHGSDGIVYIIGPPALLQKLH